MHGVAENEKEDERKEVVEEQDRPVPKRELQIDLRESEKRFHRINRGASCQLVR